MAPVPVAVESLLEAMMDGQFLALNAPTFVPMIY
jgi:hypothetical protein